MDIDSLDIKNSILQKRIVHTRNLSDKIWHYIHYSFVTLTLFAIPLAFSIKYTIEDSSIISILVFVLIIALGYLFFYAVKNNYNLVSIKGIDVSQNKELVMKSAKELDWHIDSNRKSYSILSKTMSWRNNHLGRDMIIFYKNECIYFNCITSIGASFIGNSPFHWFGNRNEEEKFTHALLGNIYKTYKQ